MSNHALRERTMGIIQSTDKPDYSQLILDRPIMAHNIRCNNPGYSEAQVGAEIARTLASWEKHAKDKKANEFPPD